MSVRSYIVDQDDDKTTVINAESFADAHINETVSYNFGGCYIQTRHITERDICAMQDRAIAQNRRLPQPRPIPSPLTRPPSPIDIPSETETKALDDLHCGVGGQPSMLANDDDTIIVARTKLKTAVRASMEERCDLTTPPRITPLRLKLKKVQANDNREIDPPIKQLPAKTMQSSSSSSGEVTFDTAHVNAHPGETFHHLGRGRWGRGMPPPESDVRMAVRGPGLAAWKAMNAKAKGK